MYISSNPALPIIPSLGGYSQCGFEAMLAGCRITTYARAREALADCIQAAEIKPGERVLIPAYICSSVIDPFERLGIDVRFYPLDRTLAPDLPSIQKLFDEKPRAIVIVHYFGWPARAKAVIDACRAEGMLVVEDCAHTLPLRHPQSIGRGGDITVYSLSKLLPITDGAVAVLHNPRLHWPSPPTAIHWRFVQINLVWQIANALESKLGLSLRMRLRERQRARQLVSAWREPAASQSTLSKYPRFRFSPIAQRIQRRLDFEAIGQQRRENCRYLAGLVRDLPGVQLLFGDLEPVGAPLGLPILVERRELVRRRLIDSGIDPRPIWSGLPSQVPAAGFEQAHEIAAHNIVLPIHQDLTHAQLERIAKAVERSLS